MNHNKQDIKLIAFDLDNTFLDSKKRIPEENLRALEKAAEKGIVPVPATGRLYGGLPAELRELPYFRYYILINGAKVYDAKEDKVLYAAELSNDRALSLFAHAREVGCYYDCYLRDQGLMDKASYDSIDEFVSDRIYADYMRSIRMPIEDLADLVRQDGGPVQKVQYFFKDMEERARQLSLLPKLFPDIIATTSMPMNIEINAANASKGPALARLCRALGFTEENAVAFGDSTNDLDMIETAGIGVAMCNSEKRVLRVADKITACDNNDAGVGKTIMELINKG